MKEIKTKILSIVMEQYILYTYTVNILFIHLFCSALCVCICVYIYIYIYACTQARVCVNFILSLSTAAVEVFLPI